MERTVRIEKDEVYREDYQIRMMRENQITGLLPLKGSGREGKSLYEYDVSGKTSMKKYYEKRQISGKEICSFLNQLQKTINRAEEFLLSVHNIVLDSQYIFTENGTYFFCYDPARGISFWDSFHSLSEEFVKWTDYKDARGVRMMFILHKESMEGNYSLKRLIKECEDELEISRNRALEEREKETDREQKKREKEKEEQKEEKSRGRGFWKKKRKKDKWGRWEGI